MNRFSSAFLRAPALAILAILAAMLCTARAPGQSVGRGASVGGNLAIYAAERAFSERNYDLAWELSLGALAEFPASYEAIRAYIQVAAELNRQADVFARFNPAEAATPEQRARAYYARALLAYHGRDDASAREEINRAIAQGLRPAPFEIRRLDLVIARTQRKRPDREILADYEKLVADHPDNGLAHLSYVNSFMFLEGGTRRHRRALAAAMAAPERTPGIYLRQAGFEQRRFWFDPARALEIVNEGLAEFPDSPDLAQDKIGYLRRLGRTIEALELAREWRAKAPNHGPLLVATVDLLEDLGRFDDAIAEARAAEALTGQTSIVERLAIRRAWLRHMGGDRDGAIADLSAMLDAAPRSPAADQARRLLYALQTAPPDSRVRVIAGGGYIQQRGNYCGPATLSMILAHWGIERGQDAVAASVYTGIAGTPPQVIHHYVESAGLRSIEFKGTEENWKRLVDAGIPVLWLQMLGSDGGHYRLVVGYDDLLRNWIVVDPNNYMRTEMPYDAVDDRWILPSLRRSIAIVPTARIADPALADLAPTPILFVTNWVIYVATGANLFVGLFPALLVNMLVAALLAWAGVGLLRRITYPNTALRPVRMMLYVVAPIALLNLAVGIFRLSQGVSVLLSFHLALVTLIPLLALLLLFRRLIHDVLHPRESLGLVGLAMTVWLSLAFIDRDPWEWAVPVALLAICLPWMLWPRLSVKRAEHALRNGELARALELARPAGIEGRRYFAAIAVELDTHLAAAAFDRVTTTAKRVLAADDGLAPAQRHAVRLYQIAAETLRFADEDIHAEIVEFLAQPRLPRALRTIAQGLQLHAAGEVAARGGSVKGLPNHTEVDALLGALSRLGRRALPGFPLTRTLRGRSLQSCAFLLALTGALRLADAAEDPERRQQLWMTWAGRYGLLLRLVRGFEVSARPSRAVVRRPAPPRDSSEHRIGSGLRQ